MRFSLFMKIFIQIVYRFCILVFFFLRFFKIKFGDLLTILKNLEIQDGGSKMANFLKCMTLFCRGMSS